MLKNYNKRYVSEKPTASTEQATEKTNVSGDNRNNDTALNNPLLEKRESGATLLLSMWYGLLLIILTVVFKVSQYVTKNGEKIYSFVFDCYYIILLSVGVLWFIFFAISTTSWSNLNKHVFIKKKHSSNWWLKGVLALFGLAIVIKNGLELIAIGDISNPKCKEKLVLTFLSIINSLFICGQVGFLFLYSKLHIQNFKSLARFGVMHVMSTNISVWIATIADETYYALNFEDIDVGTTVSPLKHIATSSLQYALQNITKVRASNLNESYESTISFTAPPSTEESLFQGDCSCNTNFCATVYRADFFLFPFFIEFCLLSTTLLYFVWISIGTMPVSLYTVVKPSYKLYSSYKGPVLGTVVIGATIIITVLLGNLESGTPPSEKSYFTEHEYLLIYNSFLVACNTSIAVACAAGVYIHYNIFKHSYVESAPTLDIVLLFICLTALLSVDFFSVLALLVGDPSTKASSWVVSLIYPIIEVVGNVFQMVLIVYDSSRKAGTTKILSFTDNSQQEQHTVRNRYFAKNNMQDGSIAFSKNVVSHGGFNFRPIKPTTLSDESIENRPVEIAFNQTRCERLDQVSSTDDFVVEEISTSSQCAANPESTDSDYENTRILESIYIKKIRLVLRNLLLFLVISNACLWVFFSLDGTAFTVYPFQYQYFGHSTWVTLTTVTKPFSVFFRMHSAACLFEIWSYS